LNTGTCLPENEAERLGRAVRVADPHYTAEKHIPKIVAFVASELDVPIAPLNYG
jgi:hypothetical protein